MRPSTAGWVVRKSVEDDNGNWVWHYWCSPPAYEGVDWVAALNGAAKKFTSKQEAESVLIGLRLEERHMMVEICRLRGAASYRERRSRVPQKRVWAEKEKQ